MKIEATEICGFVHPALWQGTLEEYLVSSGEGLDPTAKWAAVVDVFTARNREDELCSWLTAFADKNVKEPYFRALIEDVLREKEFFCVGRRLMYGQGAIGAYKFIIEVMLFVRDLP